MSTPDHSFLFVTYIHTLGSFSNDDGDGKNLSAVLKKSTPGKFAYTCHFQQIGIETRQRLKKRGIHFKTDIFATVAVADAKAPYCLQVAITTPEGGSWGYRYIKISAYR